MKFKRMEFDTREWSDEKKQSLINKLKSEGYLKKYPDEVGTGETCISTYEHGTYALYDVTGAVPTFLTTYEEYMGAAQEETTKEHNTFTLKSKAVFAATRVLFFNQILHAVDGNEIIVNASDADKVKELFKSNLILFVCE